MTDGSVAKFGLFIAGEEIEGHGGPARPLLDPAHNRPIAEVAVGNRDDARRALEAAQAAFERPGWATDDGSLRAQLLRRLAAKLAESAEAFARLETLTMGKPLRESRGDLQYVVRTLEYVSGLADKIEGSTIPVPGPRFDYTLREPLGVTVHIAPWNYPLLLAMRSVAPALAAGNTVVLKPATQTPLTAIALARLAHEVGLPPGVLNVVTGAGGDVGEALVDDPRCRQVSFTGSGPVGRRIAELAARRVIPVTLELGGKSPVVIFPDADLDRAAKGVVYGIFGNAGQMCWAGSRLLLHESIQAPFLERVKALAEKLKLGPGVEETTEMGPLVTRDHLDSVLGFIDRARSEGSRIVTGGERPAAPALAEGNYLQPTVLADLPPTSPIAQEEIFGPVLATFAFADADEAVRLANQTRYGLFAAVWTRDLGTAHTLARRIEAGMVVVNESPLTFPQTPFGGYKESGLGSEQGRHALDSYLRTKNVSVNLGAPRKKA
ncbi:MAG: aldehyde dehydrogenase family protein [Thermoplasmata archaeon]|jgi:acyl-CoA reductase-like NAD-dependent aldehyde dehydrogenase